MNAFTENHLVEQPAIQLMQHELDWEVVNCYDEWNGGVSNQGRDGKREVVLASRLRTALQQLNPDLPVEAIEGAVEEVGILNVEFWILNGRGRLPTAPRLNLFHPALSLAEANREIDELLRSKDWGLFVPEPAERCKRLKMNKFLFELKTSA